MKKNMGNLDRYLRISIALALLLAILSNSIAGWWSTLAGVIIIVLLATAIYGVCPLYTALKFNTLFESDK